jgi:FKBP-type peptidyl-prolyl cis-trans isomerase SlyD
MVVAFGYRMRDAEGEIVESSEPDEAISFLWGYGQVAPPLEVALAGLATGQTKRIELRPEDAFGDRDEDALIHVDKDEFPSSIAVGEEYEAESESGELVSLRVLEVTEESVVLDTNHPLAGQRIELEITVLAVRLGSAEELAAATADLLTRQNTGGDVLLPAARLLGRRSAAPKVPDSS